MKVNEVPQDNVKKEYTRGETKDVHYAVDENGNMVKILSKGWDVMADSLENLNAMYAEFAEDAKERIKKGETSPIEYFMHKIRMDIPLLAAQMDMSARKVKKQFNPKVFNKLDDSILQKYAEVLKINIDEIKKFKKETY